MFLTKYLDQTKFELLCSNYESWYLESLEEPTFKEIYNLFEKYNFYFIEDIILNYLEIFEETKDFVEEGILELKEELGNNYIYLIANDLRFLEKLLY